MINLLIADDHPFFVQGVMLSLKGTEVNVLQHVAKAEEIIDAYSQHKPDILVCDIKFGDELNGFDALDTLLEKEPDAKVIFLSQFDQNQMIREAYKRGAKAFLSKSTSSDELITAIQTVNSGELYFTPENAIKLAHMTFDKENLEKNVIEILNAKEIEVFKLLANGNTEKEVATTLNISPKTVTNIKANIKNKLSIEKVTSMTKLALKFGLIDWDDE